MPALTVDGYLPDPLIIQGSITKELFLWWLVNNVIPHLAPDTVIVMDNAAIHHNLDEIEPILKARRLSIAYLPPYSPDYMPIEKTFHLLKHWMRRYARLMPQYGEDNGL